MEEETAEEEHKEVKYRSSFSDVYDSQDEMKELSLYAIGMVNAGFNFSACVLESESRARFISPL